ncbi:MAG: YncE family protein [Pseudomonas mandelii]
MNSTRTPLTAPSVKVNLDALDWKDAGIRLASLEGFYPCNGLKVTIDAPCIAPDNELELLLDDKVIARHIISTAEVGSPLTILVKPEDLTDGRHELNYRVKSNNQTVQTCEQPAEIQVALKSLTDLCLDKVPSRHHGPFAQIQIRYPQAASPTALANNNIQMVQGIHGLTLSRDASRLYFIQSPDGSVSYVKAMDTRTHTIVGSYSPETGGETLGGLSPNGEHAYVNSRYSNYIWEINTKTHEIKKGADLESGAPYMVVSPTGKRLYACSTQGLNGYLKAVDTSSQSVVLSLLISPWPFGLAINSSGSRVYLAHGGDAESDSDPTVIDVIDTEKLKTVARIPITGSAYSMALNQDSTRLYVADISASEIAVIDTATNKIINVARSEKSPRHVSLSADGKHLYVVTFTSAFIWVLDAVSLEVIQKIDTGKNNLREVLARPDNGIFVLYFY